MSEKIIMYDHLVKIVHKLYCDDCDVEMKSTGMCYTVNPPLYEYYCPNCNKRINKQQTYPWTELVGELIDG